MTKQPEQAWLHLDKNNILKSMGGNLKDFGLNTLEKGHIVHENSNFLDGILSTENPPHFIENIEIEDGKYADIHIINEQDESWVILLGQSEQINWKGIAHQKTNELSLLKTKISNNKEVNLRELLNIIVLEQNDDSSFKLIEDIPSSFCTIFNNSNITTPEKDFPFLANFITESSIVWKDRKITSLKSGPWIEVNLNGKEYALEATSIFYKQRKLLLIELLDGQYQRYHSFLQQGREIELIKISLEKEILRRNIKEHHLLIEKQQSELENQEKTHYLASIGHEVRTPLNSILGFSELILSNKDEPLTNEQRENLEHIVASGKHLLNIIEEHLESTKTLWKYKSLTTDKMSPSEIINESLPLLRVLSNKKLIIINYKKTGDTIINACPLKFKQIIINLIGNAIKYSPSGDCITIDEELTNDGYYRLIISDNGVGIEADKHDKIFSTFERLGQEMTNIEGSGLGLFVTKSIVESMGGHIGFESTKSIGSKFWVDFLIHKEN